MHQAFEESTSYKALGSPLSVNLILTNNTLVIEF